MDRRRQPRRAGIQCATAVYSIFCGRDDCRRPSAARFSGPGYPAGQADNRSMDKVACQVLNHFPVDVRPRQVDSLGSAGGLSGARFWRFATGRGELVLRRWPQEHPPPDRLQFIHAVLRHAAEGSLSFLPVPLATTAGESFVEHAGHLWELTPWLPGVADFPQVPSDARRDAAMTALARFHVATEDFAQGGVPQPAPTVVERRQRLEGLFREEATSMRSQFEDDASPTIAPIARRFLALATEQLPAVIRLLEPHVERPFALQPAIRDVWHDHVLFTGDQVTGLIDFGAMRIDTPVADVARLLGSLAGDDTRMWEGGIAAYEQVRSLSPDERSAVVALDVAGTLLGGCNWVRWVFLERRRFERTEVVRGRLQALLARLTRFSRQGTTWRP